jgi:hypothetical protein
MARQTSNQISRVEADNAISTQFLNPKEKFGRPHPFAGTFNTTDDLDAGGVLAQDDVLDIALIPQGTTLFLGEVSFEAMGAGATLDLGLRAADDSGFLDADGTVADDEDFFAAAIDVSAAGYQTFQSQLGFYYTTEKPLYLTGTLAGAVWAANSDLIASILGVDRT